MPENCLQNVQARRKCGISVNKHKIFYDFDISTVLYASLRTCMHRFRQHIFRKFQKIEYDIMELQKNDRRKTQMKYKALMVLAAVPIMLTGCMQSREPELTPEELEHNALVEWFET